MPRVSIIIPTYNRAPLLKYALDSVMAQSFQDFEVILVDDASTDDTEQLVERYSREVRYVRLGKHFGLPSVARNAGLQIARGDYVAFLDSDDQWPPQKVERQVRILDRYPNVGLVCSNALVLEERQDKPNRLYLQGEYTRSGWVLKELLHDNFVITSTAVIRRSLLERVGIFSEDPLLRGVEDYDLWLRIAAASMIYYIPEPLAIYRDHTGSIRAQQSRVSYWQGMLLILRLLRQRLKDWGHQDALSEQLMDNLTYTYFGQLLKAHWDSGQYLSAVSLAFRLTRQRPMNGLKLFLIRLFRTVTRLPRHAAEERVVTIFPSRQPLGRVLFSYLNYSILWKDDNTKFSGHSNKWESREIARIFQRMGFTVDAISWTDQSFVPQEEYDVIFDISTNLGRLAPFLSSKAMKLLHLTGSYAPYQNAAELERIRALQERRGIRLAPRRLVKDLELFENSLDLADMCSLIGSERTLQTFPEHYQRKITLVTVSASYTGWKKDSDALVPEDREFLWFFGGGAVHKGLDLVLEAFAGNPDLKLNVVGPVHKEEDFFHEFRKELTQLPNIRYHGYVDPASDKFREIVSRVFCFIAPCCSEAISPAAATCLQIGLFPIISYEAGISLPEGQSMYLETCSAEEIALLARQAHGMHKDELHEQISSLQKFAEAQYSREKFSADMTKYLSRVLSDGARS